MAGGSCEVCKEAPSKYKCPACRTPYWRARSSRSLEEGTNCPNDKDQDPPLLPGTTCSAQSPNTPCPTKALEVEDPSWLVDKNRLRSLVESDEIRDALKDSKLQEMLVKIDGSTEPEKILDIVSPQQ
uniref:HIT-type domain-containing protein n=1 Tax=Leersia perrieri TaxID=77586 RepID=A0A0D9V7E3_9ORYZ